MILMMDKRQDDKPKRTPPPSPWEEDAETLDMCLLCSFPVNDIGECSPGCRFGNLRTNGE